MSEAKHTPTPWVVEENVYAGGVVHLAITNRAEPRYWMPCSVTPQIDARPIDYANAEFIVRACNMHDQLLAACKELVTSLDALIAESGGVFGLHLNGDNAEWGDLTQGGRYEEWLLPLESARAAIAAAETEQE